MTEIKTGFSNPGVTVVTVNNTDGMSKEEVEKKIKEAKEIKQEESK